MSNNKILSSRKPNAKYFLFGAGQVGKTTYLNLQKYNLINSNVYFVDNNINLHKTHIEFFNDAKIPIISKFEMLSIINDDDIVIVTVGKYLLNEILDDLKSEIQLKNHHIFQVKDIFTTEVIDNLIYSHKNNIIPPEIINLKYNFKIIINATNNFSDVKLLRTINSLSALFKEIIVLHHTPTNVNLADSNIDKMLNITFIQSDNIFLNHYDVITHINSYPSTFHNILKENYIIFMNAGDSLTNTASFFINNYLNNFNNKKIILSNRDVLFKDDYISPLFKSNLVNFKHILNSIFNDFLMITYENLIYISDYTNFSSNDCFIIPEIIYHLDYNNINKQYVKTIPYYLTQFHTTPENDNWWGEGFTEWTNTKVAKPLFDGHYQPHEPHDDIGYYDLIKDTSIQHKQISMAKEYGLHGFCYYYYHFSGQRMLEKPFNNMIENKSLDFPFCIFWANEDWTRSWEGKDKEILVKQICDEDNCINFIHEVIPLFKDSRYITVNNKPILVVYRAASIPNFHEIVNKWQSECLKAGLLGLEVVPIAANLHDPRIYNCNYISEFVTNHFHLPHEKQIKNIPKLTPNFNGTIFDYSIFSQLSSSRLDCDFTTFPCTTIGFDNTARKKENATIYDGVSIELYQKYLATNIDYITTFNAKDAQINFVFAWNEWAEAAHLEPDKKYGYQFLKATKEVITNHNL